MTSPAGTSSSSPSSGSGFWASFVYIYDIPRLDRKRLSCHLDRDGKWVNLAIRRMGYRAEDVEDIQRCCGQSGQSPSEQLLTKWGNLNHKVMELFVVLSQEGLYEAMEVIKSFVDPQFHSLLRREPVAAVSTKEVNGPARSSSPVVEPTKDTNSEAEPKPREFKQIALTIPPPIPAAAPGPPGAARASPVTPLPPGMGVVPDGLPQLNYEELRVATANWNPQNELGRGGFGVVYKGFFKFTNVAIKKIKGINTESARTELRQSFNELKYLNSCRHENVVQLLGCSFECGEPCLVYQFMPGGSLDMRLFPKSSNVLPLNIVDRIKIAKGTAKGLQYLHTFTQKPIIHGDIKPGNILLDNANEPKIGDFGLTRELSVSEANSMKVSRVYGTRPYIPPEFFRDRHLSTKVDSYSYGLVLYEMITGLRVLDDKRPIKHLKEVVDNAIECKLEIRVLIDKTLPTADDPTLQVCKILLGAGRLCTMTDPDKRHEMVNVYKFLITNLGV